MELTKYLQYAVYVFIALAVIYLLVGGISKFLVLAGIAGAIWGVRSLMLKRKIGED